MCALSGLCRALARLPRRPRLGAGAAAPGRTKTTRAARGARRCADLLQADAFDALEHQLSDALTSSDRAGHRTKVGEQHLHLAAIVAIDCARTIEHGEAVPERQPGARPHLRLKPRRQFQDEAGGDEGACAGSKPERATLGDRGEQIHTGRAIALITRQIETLRVGQPHHAHQRSRPGGLGGHVSAVCSASHCAARATSRRATSALGRSGQFSTSVAVTRCTVLRSPPMMPVLGETSLARIQSAPLAVRFFLAKSTTFVVSAAKPITSGGRRPGGVPAMVFKISGFSTSSSLGAPALAPFFSFSEDASATRQLATSAAKMPTSHGSAWRTAASISCAVSTLTRSTPAGAGSWLGPEMSVTRAPSRRASAAMGVPCLPEERLAM